MREQTTEKQMPDTNYVKRHCSESTARPFWGNTDPLLIHVGLEHRFSILNPPLKLLSSDVMLFRVDCCLHFVTLLCELCSPSHLPCAVGCGAPSSEIGEQLPQMGSTFSFLEETSHSSFRRLSV